MRPDLLHVDNLIRVIKKASFKEFDGLEALALASAFKWLNEQKSRLEQEIRSAGPHGSRKPEPKKGSKKK